MIFLDLDGFKAVNDSLGHDTGDLVLKEVARRLDSCARSSDTVARLGGDEFVVLVEDPGNERGATLVAERIRAELDVLFEVGRRELPVTASIGVAVWPGPGSGPRELLRAADLAMYRAKEKGKNRCEIYDPGAPARPGGRGRGRVRA